MGLDTQGRPEAVTNDTTLFGEPLPRLGAPLFAERWSNRKAFWIGVYAGQRLSASAICTRLADGITPNAVTAMLSQWGFTICDDDQHSYAHVAVRLTGKDRTKIDREALRRGANMADLCQQVLERVARDDLWRAVLDA